METDCYIISHVVQFIYIWGGEKSEYTIVGKQSLAVRDTQLISINSANCNR